MEQKIVLKHPEGKKAISMNKVKYDMLKKALVNYLEEKKQATYTEIWKSVAEDFIKRKIPFQGSVQWHMEWVKLDLEANRIIERVPGTAPQKYALI